MFSLSLSGVRAGVRPGVADPRGVMASPACGVMLSDPWPWPGVLRQMTHAPNFILRRVQHSAGRRRAFRRLPEGGAEHGVGGLHLLPLGRHAAEIALVQRRVQAALQWGVDVGQRHQILSFLGGGVKIKTQNLDRCLPR